MSHKPATKPLEIVPGVSHLYRRGARYYFRMVVPEPLRRIVGKWELVESLNTSNFADAKRLLPERINKAHIVLDTAKLRTNAGIGGYGGPGNFAAPREAVIFPPPLPPNSPRDINSRPWRQLPGERPVPLILHSEEHAQEIARRYFVELEKKAAREWSETVVGLTASEIHEIRVDLSMERQRYEGNPECDDGLLLYDDGRELVWLYLERENRMMEADSPDLITLARLFREAKLEHIHRQADRVDGRPFRAYSPLFHDLSARSLIKPEAQEMTLEALCTRFIAEREKAHKAHKTQLQTQVGANLLMELFGRHTPANRITRDDAERFCTILETIPLNLRKRYPGLTISDAIEAARKNGETLGACRV